MAKAPASLVNDKLEAYLQRIQLCNGFGTDVKAVFRGSNKVPDKQDRPYICMRVQSDVRTSSSGSSATRLRTYLLEVVFSHAVDDDELDQAQRDILRCVGFGEPDFDRRFPGLIDEADEAAYEYPEGGSKNRSVVVQLGVTYVDNYGHP